MDPTTTLEAVRKWSVEDRFSFVFDLRDQLIEDGWQPEPKEELVAELDRRLAAHEANPSKLRTWEQVLERVYGQRSSD